MFQRYNMDTWQSLSQGVHSSEYALKKWTILRPGTEAEYPPDEDTPR